MADTNSSRGGRGIAFGLIFFSSSEAPFNGDKYRLVIESTRYADQHGFASVWIPERHFTKDGWLYPNPAVLQAALARETSQISLRAGSVVLPLHNPLRVAEEWAMVDNLSGGRVGLSFASGWHPNDFALFPEHYEKRNEVMYEGIELVRKLWRGESIQMPGGDGKLIELQTYPTPIQPELPIWITAAGNPKTFEGAGKIGAHVLTHMYNHGVDELAEKIRIYRKALADHGYDPAQGKVSVMLHTFVSPDADKVRQQARGPFIEYLKSAAYLVNAIAQSRGQKVDLKSLSEQDLQDYLFFVFERLVSNQRVLFGTPEACRETVSLLQGAGVDEIACQMDFGIPIDDVLESLPHLHDLKNLCNPSDNAPVQSPVMKVPAFSSNGAHQTRHKENGASTSLSDTLPAIRQRCTEEVTLPDFYHDLSNRGIQLGTSFQGIDRLWRRDGEALGQVRLPTSVTQDIDKYSIHPTLLDACFQVIIAAVPAAISSHEQGLYLPTGIRRFVVHQQPGRLVWSHARIESGLSDNASVIEGQVRILDERGQLLVEATGLQLQRSEPAASAPRPSTTEQLHDWLYELQWEQKVLPTPAQKLDGHWLLFLDRQGIGKQLSDTLVARGAQVTEVLAGTTYQTTEQGQYRLDPVDPVQMKQLLQDMQANRTEKLQGVIHLWSLDATPAPVSDGKTLEVDQVRHTGSALHLIQALVAQTDTLQPRLWLVTRGAQAINTTDIPEISQSSLWGLGKTCAIEHPELWGGLIDIDPHATQNDAAQQLLQATATEQTEDQLAFREQQSYVARMVRVPDLPTRPFQVRQDSTYIISGGLWGLGLEVAHWLAKQGAGHLLLLGRSRLPNRNTWDQLPRESRAARQVAALHALEELGTCVHYASVDIANEEQLTTFLQTYRQQGYAPVRGVIHAASVWQDEQGQSLVRPLISTTLNDLHTVLRPKVSGGWLLHNLLQNEPLDFFVSFSSGASLFGSAAQGNYAAAGEFLDTLAHYQRAQGIPGLSIDWGAVSDIGFGATAEGVRVHEYWETHGIYRISPAQVLTALETLIPQQRARVGVLKLEWQALQEFFPQLTRLPLVAHLVPEKAQTQTHNQGPANGRVPQTILTGTTSEKLAQLQTYLCEQVAGVLQVPAHRLDTTQPLTTLGLDSLMAIELKNRIEHELHVRIPIVAFLQGPSIEQFTIQIMDQFQGEQTPETTPEQTDKALPALAEDAETLLGQLDQLSDQEVDTLLQQMLADGNIDDEHEGYQEHVEDEHTVTINAHDAE